jgi:hypothetical protein
MRIRSDKSSIVELWRRKSITLRKGTLRKSGARATTQTQFFGERGSECLGLAIEPNLYKETRDIAKCKDLEMLKVKVPIRFLGTMGFSARREGRYP